MPKYKLMSHQRDGVKFLDSVDGIGALLWEPGVGKTGCTMAYIDRLAERYKDVRVLVVAPLIATDTWVTQIASFMDSPSKGRVLEGRTADILSKIKESRHWGSVPQAHVEINHKGSPTRAVNGHRVTLLSLSAGAVSSWCSNRVKTVQMLSAIRTYKPHLIIVDESHIIKSSTANISKAMYQIGQLSRHRIILTGTVNPHSSLDCYGQWRFLAPWTFSDQYHEDFTKNPLRMTREQIQSIRPWAFGRFRNRYALMGGFQNHQVLDINPDTITELQDRVAERSMVVLKSDALDLPPVTEVNVHIKLSAKEQSVYSQMRKDLAAQMEDGSLLEAPNAVAKIMKLRQITAGFAKDTQTGEVYRIGRTKQKAVRELVDDVLVAEKRVVVFAYFSSEISELAKALRKAGRTVDVITGKVKRSDRRIILNRFKDTENNPGQVVLVAQISTMSLSVNELITAQNAIFSTLSYRRDEWIQARGRLDRNGQKGSQVTFWNVYAPGTIDEIILDRHKHRGDLEKALLDHIRAVVR